MLDPQFDRLARHHSRFERTFHRSLNALKALQTDDAIRATLPIRVGAKTPILANPLIIAKRSHERDQQHRQRNADRVRNEPQTTAA
jgi:hypothetical protein